MKRNKFCEGKSKLAIFLILVVVILALGAGFFYYKVKANRDIVDLNSTAPKLFEKGDYKVEDREDGQYIVVDKVGLTAKVPEGWRVEFSKVPTLETEEYWVDLYSQDATGTDYLKSGCGITISIGMDKDSNEKTRDEITQVKNGTYEPWGAGKDNIYEVKKINNYEVLWWVSPERRIVGQFIGFDVALKKELLLSISTSLPPDYKEKCSPIWEDFVKNIAIK